MSQKKPIWTTTDAHKRLKEYCQATKRTQLEVVSELILESLSADGKRLKEEDTSKRGTNERTFGGVWVV